MKQANSRIFFSLRVLAAVGLLCCLAAHADEYSDVSQLARNGKLSEALNRADQYLASQPKDPQMRFIKGVIQRDSGKTSEAITTFTRLTEDYPELPEPYNNLAVLYAGQSQFDKARSALEMAIRTNPSYATAHENLGDIYAKLASQAYNKALQLDSANQAVPPKLALIREIFSTTKTQRPVAAAASTPAVAPTPVAAPVVTAKPTAPAAAPVPTPTAVAVVPVAPPVVKPVASAPAAAATAASAPESAAAKDVEAAVAAWAHAWSARDVKAYLSAYGKDFNPPGTLSRKAWEDERQQRIAGKASISVKVDKLNISINGNRATAKFRQDYKAGGLAVNSSKTLEFARSGERWQIVKETVGN